MERRKALVIAAVTTAVVLTGAVAAVANTGLLGFGAEDDRLGQLDARNVAELAADWTAPESTTTSEPTLPEIIVVDEYVNDGTGASSGSPDPGASSSSSGDASTPASSGQPATVDSPSTPPPYSGGSHYEDDDDHYEDDDDHYEDDDHEEEEHEGDEDDD